MSFLSQPGVRTGQRVERLAKSLYECRIVERPGKSLYENR
jgi:hypothetical protein